VGMERVGMEHVGMERVGMERVGMERVVHMDKSASKGCVRGARHGRA